MSRKTICILFLGGATIDNRQRLGDTVNKPAHVKPWLRTMSEMDIIANTEGIFIVSGLTAVGIPEWQSAGATIKQRYRDVDGFVVIHQLETLPAAAKALSLMLQSLGKPVVLCGSPLLNDEEKNAGPQKKKPGMDFGAKANFINAVQVAVSDIAGVVVVYGSHIYRGATISGPMSDIQGEVLGKIDFGIRFIGKQTGRMDRLLKLQSKFETKIAVAEYLPGVDLQHFLHLPRGTKAIFLSSPEGSGSVESMVQKMRQSLPSQIPIIVYSSTTDPVISGTLAVHGPSRSAALLQLMWALGQTSDLKKLRKLLL